MSLEEEVSPLAEERRRRIVRLLADKGAVTVGALVDLLEVTPMTVWRDLKRLEHQGLLRRVRGGAVRPEAQTGAAVSAPNPSSLRPKQAIGEYAAKHFVQEGNILFLGGGSTIGELVGFLPPAIQIITNSLQTLSKLRGTGQWSHIQCSGGILNVSSGDMTGPDARRFFASKRADVCFMSATALDLHRGICDPNPVEVELKTAMASSAAAVIALVDSTKLGKSSLEQVLPLSGLTALVTDDNADGEILKKLEKAVDLHIAPTSGGQLPALQEQRHLMTH